MNTENKTVYFLLADGFEEIEALAPIDILLRGGISVKKLSVTGSLAVTGSHGITVMADALCEESLPDAAMLVFPGGMPGATTLDAYENTTALCAEAVKNGAHLAAICAAPLVLGKRGYLDGKRAVCYPGFEAHLLGAEVVDARVVTDGNVTTAVGMGAANEFGLRLLALLCGDEVANKVKTAAFL